MSLALPQAVNFKESLARFSLAELKKADNNKYLKSWKKLEHAVENLKQVSDLFETFTSEKDNFLAHHEPAYTLTYKAQKISRSVKPSSPKLKKAVTQIQRLIFSLRLGGLISCDDLKSNPDYETFLKVNFWNYRATRYNQVLPKVEGEVGVIYNGHSIPFKNILEITHVGGDWDGLPIVHPHTKKLLCAPITQKGITVRSHQKRKKLLCQEKKDSSQWGNNYIYEIVTSVKDKNEESPRFSGDHGWLRLKNPEGYDFSWGIIRPNVTFLNGLTMGGKIMMTGAYVMPDFFEGAEKKENHQLITQILITKEQFEEEKKFIEKLNNEGIPFSAIHKLTCQGHAVHIAKRLGIKAEGEMTVATFIGRKLFGMTLTRIYRKIMPAFIRATFTYISDFFLGFLMRLGQIHAMDPKVREKYGHEYDGFLHSFWNFFKPVRVQHPIALRKWQRKIEAYRASEEGRRKGPFAIPEQYLIKKAV